LTNELLLAVGSHLSLGFNVLSAVMMAIEQTSDRCSWDFSGGLSALSLSAMSKSSSTSVLHGGLLVPAFPRPRPGDDLVKAADDDDSSRPNRNSYNRFRLSMGNYGGLGTVDTVKASLPARPLSIVSFFVNQD
jgi:hypothetical protein